MSAATDTGRTTEEMWAELAALRAENEALRSANAQLADDEWEPHPSLFAKRGETVGHVVKPERYKALLAAEAEAAQLRSRLLQAEKDLSFKTAVVDTLSTGIGDARRLTNGWAKGTLLLLPFVDMAAGEGLEWVEQEDSSPRMDAADLCAAFAKVMGCELGDAAYTALLAEGRDAIRALNPNQSTSPHSSKSEV